MSRQTTLGRFGFKKGISHRNSVMETKYPILFQLCQGQLSVITAVNSLITSKGCLCMRNVRMVLDSGMTKAAKIISILFKISASALFLKYS